VVESQQAFEWLARYGQGREVETAIMEMGRRVRAVVPECVALSLCYITEGFTFTLVAENRDAALIDALQYLDGGPCEKAVRTGERTAASMPFQEEHWGLMARGWNLVGVASSLSMPVLSASQVVGGLNLYACTATAFQGHHQELAQACGAWAGGAVSDADLAFTSRIRAAATPWRLREKKVVDVASGFLAEYLGTDVAGAASRITNAAQRAGVSESDLARFILDAHERQL
jgi:GAF domain-containing protein